jgi:hypothetical protein
MIYGSARSAADIELEIAGNHDHGTRPISALGTHVSERRVARGKQAAGHSLSVLHHPIAAVILTDHENRRPK